MKALLILIVGFQPVTVDKTEFSTLAQCQSASQALWSQYKTYEGWARSPDAVRPAQQLGNVTVGPTSGPTVPYPWSYCIEVD